MTGDEVNVASRHQILLPVSVEYTEEPEEHVDNQSTSASESMAEDDHLCTAAVVIVVDDPVSHVTTIEPPPLIQVARHSKFVRGNSIFFLFCFFAFWLIGLLIRLMCGVWCELDEGDDPFGRIVLSLVHGWRSTLLRLCPFFFFQLNGAISKVLLVRLLTGFCSFLFVWSLLFITRPGCSSLSLSSTYFCSFCLSQ